MLPYQDELAALIARQAGLGQEILPFHQGVGRTQIVAKAAALRAPAGSGQGGRVLVVTSKVLESHWLQCWRRVSSRPARISSGELGGDPEGLTIVSVDLLRSRSRLEAGSPGRVTSAFHETEWDLVIVDWLNCLKGMKTKRKQVTEALSLSFPTWFLTGLGEAPSGRGLQLSALGRRLAAFWPEEEDFLTLPPIVRPGVLSRPSALAERGA